MRHTALVPHYCYAAHRAESILIDEQPDLSNRLISLSFSQFWGNQLLVLDANA